MSMLDFLTGGKSGQAEEALNQAMEQLGAVKAPSIEDLTLPELQKYVQQGILTPEQAQAVLVKTNSYNDIQTSSKPVEAEMSALSSLEDIANSGGMDAKAKADLAQAANQSQITAQGQRGSIIDQMAARGIPTSLISEALQSAAAGQDAQTQSLVGAQAAGDAEQRALAALTESGTLGGNIHNQEYSEAANKAAAQNAINQWNAQNQTNVGLTNTAANNAAQQSNLANAQNISNTNTQNANQRTAYNANLAQTVYQDAMQKAQAQAGIRQAQAGQYTNQGQQNAGIWGGLVNLAAPQPYTGQSAGSTFAGGGGAGGGGSVPGAAMGAGSGSGEAAFGGAESAAMVASSGGAVPGKSAVAGDSPKNDNVPAMLSAGEVVIPRSIAPHPELAKRFIEHVMRNKVQIKPAHPDDVRSVLEALNSRRA